MNYKVLIPQDISRAGKDYLERRGFQVTVLNDSSEKAVCEAVGDYDAVLARTAPYTRAIIQAGKKLKVIARYGAGTDNIDLKAATECGVQVCNAPVANSNSVAEHTVALILACANNMVVQDRETRKGNYESRNRLKSMEVSGKTLGLIGCGHIGQRVAEKAAKGFRMKVIGFDSYLPKDRVPENLIEMKGSMDEVLAQSDFISLHVPLTRETKNMIDMAALSKMKKSAILINCARGGIINEKDLYDALKRRVIAGAGLDVFATEPVEASNPLFALDNIIVSPHNAALSYEAMDQMGIDAAKGIEEVLTGKSPTWPVNRLDD